MRTPEGKEKKEQKQYLNSDWEWPQISVRHQTTDPGSSQKAKQDKCPIHHS